jgi:hypothetical protein
MTLLPLLPRATKLPPWIRESALMSFMRRYSLIYLGIIVLVLAVSRDVLPISAGWLDTNLLAVGIAVIALGITIIALERALLPKKREEKRKRRKRATRRRAK